MKPLQKRDQYLAYFRQAIRNPPGYPLGTVAYYGPDDRQVTKIVAAALPDAETDPIIRKWFGEGVNQNPQVIGEIGAFLQAHRVQNVVIAEGIIGCPHEAGVDYPVGETCPHCPFWHEA